ncbi:hypothetical protein [Rubrivivax sp. JA1026]|uniref:hypothetical protein n=1 Tax=Rubrivivax sp. JA1026 TaxID=2710888 RepID=UPI0013E921AF|nr:hypothetical protein [Rubrivivax sp. JA1026]
MSKQVTIAVRNVGRNFGHVAIVKDVAGVELHTTQTKPWGFQANAYSAAANWATDNGYVVEADDGLAFRVVRPGAGVVSSHYTLREAESAMQRQSAGANRQGGYSQDYIEQRDEDGRFSRVVEAD